MLTVSANYSEDFGVTHSTDIQHMQQHGLYDPANEHDACGVGFVAHIKGEKSHAIVEQGLKILENLDHRGAVGADALMGDGAGLLIQLPDVLYREEMVKQGVALPPGGEYGVANQPPATAPAANDSEPMPRKRPMLRPRRAESSSRSPIMARLSAP